MISVSQNSETFIISFFWYHNRSFYILLVFLCLIETYFCISLFHILVICPILLIDFFNFFVFHFWTCLFTIRLVLLRHILKNIGSVCVFLFLYFVFFFIVIIFNIHSDNKKLILTYFGNTSKTNPGIILLHRNS